jgi:hypothetical protein
MLIAQAFTEYGLRTAVVDGMHSSRIYLGAALGHPALPWLAITAVTVFVVCWLINH